jgi:hypothetical protein
MLADRIVKGVVASPVFQPRSMLCRTFVVRGGDTHSDLERINLLFLLCESLEQESRQPLYIYLCHHKENKP